LSKRRCVSTGVAAALAAVALVAVGGASAGSRAATPVKLMVIAQVNSTGNYPDTQPGAEAAAAAINKAGGIKGRQIQIVFCNPDNNPNNSVSCARQAVEENVVAVVGHTDCCNPQSIPILQNANIPDIGQYSLGTPIDYTNPTEFPMVGGAVAAYQSIPFALKKLGKKRLVIFYQDVVNAYANAKTAQNAARAAKMPVVGKILLPGATTDFAPYVQKMRDFNPDSVMFINSVGVSGGVMRTAASLGVTKVLWTHNTGSVGEPEAAQIGAPAEGMLLAGIFPTARDTTYPGIRKWVSEMTAAGKNDPLFLKPLGLDAWLSVHAVAMIGQAMKGELTNTTLLASLRSQKKPLDLYGLVSFNPGKRGPAAFPRWGSIKEYFETVKNGQVVAWGPKLPAIYPLASQHLVR
jgi:ABC-type branched-subunit amino acid transport system substrate-binding protein